MNTLNFFITPDYPNTTRRTRWTTSAAATATSIAAAHDFDQPLEFTRQRDKLLQALAGSGRGHHRPQRDRELARRRPAHDPTDGIVAGLNALPGVGPYAAIETGVIGTDAIRVGLIYRTRRRRAGRCLQDPQLDRRPAVHRHARADPSSPRPSRTSTTGARITVAVNHLKSKGSRLHRRRRPRHRRRPGQLPADPEARRPGPRRLARHRPDRQRRSRLPDPRRPQLLRQEDPIDAIKAGPDDDAGTADDYTNLIEPVPRRPTPTRTSSTDSPATSTTPSPARRSSARSRAPPSGTSTPTSPTSSTTTRPSSRRPRKPCTSRTPTGRRTTTR